MGVKIIEVAPQFTPEARESLDVLYPAITGGLQGRGLTPDIDRATREGMLRSLTEEFPETRRQLGSQITRTIPRADVGVRGFLKESLNRQFARQKESIGREFEFRGFEDIGTSQNLAFGALASEKGIASNYADILNQSTMRRQNAPTFGSELAGGLGTAAGFLAGSRGFGGAGGADPFPSNLSSGDYKPPAVAYAEAMNRSTVQ